MKYKISALILAALLSGCAATSGMEPTVSESGYSGKKIVTIGLHSNDCSFIELNSGCTSLGAEWSGESPEYALLKVQYTGDYFNIMELKLLIDGKETVLRNNKLTSHDYASGGGVHTKFSKTHFTVPLELIRNLSNANRAWLRINSSDTYTEHRIKEGEKEGWSYHAMKRFIKKVDEIKK